MSVTHGVHYGIPSTRHDLNTYNGYYETNYRSTFTTLAIYMQTISVVFIFRIGTCGFKGKYNFACYYYLFIK